MLARSRPEPEHPGTRAGPAGQAVPPELNASDNPVTGIDIAYGGEFSVNGGAWVAIVGTVIIAGPIQPLTVKTANAQLVNP